LTYAQTERQGGAALVARFHGLSADHLEHVTPEGIAAMAASGTVAVLLPGAYYFLRETVAPPIAALRRRADGHCHRLQSGRVALDLPAAGNEHCRLVVNAGVPRAPVVSWPQP
jgi:hypothetical protein